MPEDFIVEDQGFDSGDPVYEIEQEDDAGEESPEESEGAEGESEDSSEGSESEDGEGDQFTKIDPTTLPEELQGVYKSMQADYTRKTAALAEMRRQIQGHPAVAAAIQISQLASIDPAAAAEFLRRQADSLHPLQGQEQQHQQQEDGLTEEEILSTATPTERFLYLQMKAIMQKQEELSGEVSGVRRSAEPLAQEAALQKGQAILDGIYAKVESGLGIKLSQKDRDVIAEKALSVGAKTPEAIELVARGIYAKKAATAVPASAQTPRQTGAIPPREKPKKATSLEQIFNDVLHGRT